MSKLVPRRPQKQFCGIVPYQFVKNASNSFCTTFKRKQKITFEISKDVWKFGQYLFKHFYGYRKAVLAYCYHNLLAQTSPCVEAAQLTWAITEICARVFAWCCS